MNEINRKDNISIDDCNASRRDSCNSNPLYVALDESKEVQKKISIRYKIWLIFSAMLGVGGLSCFLAALILDSRQGCDPVVVKTLRYQLFISIVVCFVCGLFTLGVAMAYKRDCNSAIKINHNGLNR